MRAYYSSGGLREWVAQKWVDIGKRKMESIPTMRKKIDAQRKISKLRSDLQKPAGDKVAKGECLSNEKELHVSQRQEKNKKKGTN